MQSKILKSFLLFLFALILMQVYYMVNVAFNLWVEYYPLGYFVHVIFYASIFIVTILFVGKLNLASLGLKLAASWRRYTLFGLVFALFHIGVRMLVVKGTFHRIYPLPLMLYVPTYIFLGLLIGLAEETAFRGYILKNLLELDNCMVAILLSSTLFGVYHIYFAGSGTLAWWALYVVQSLTAGIFMGLLYYKTGCNLLGSIIYHSTLIAIGHIIPWTPLSNPQYQLGVSTIINLIQTVILSFPYFHKNP